MNYSTLEPNVPISLGLETVMIPDTSVHPPIISKLHIIVDSWFEDAIIETFPCFIFTQELADALTSAGCSGVQYDELTVSKSPEFLEIHGDRKLPDLVWAKIGGEKDNDDFFINEDLMLVVSEKALAIINKYSTIQLNVIEKE